MRLCKRLAPCAFLLAAGHSKTKQCRKREQEYSPVMLQFLFSENVRGLAAAYFQQVSRKNYAAFFKDVFSISSAFLKTASSGERGFGSAGVWVVCPLAV